MLWMSEKSQDASAESICSSHNRVHLLNEEKIMLKKSFEIKDISEAEGGEITAYAATFDRVKDSYGDVIAPGAFAKTLTDWQESGHPIPLLFGHRTDDPRMNLGAVVEASEDERGLLIKAQFDETSDVAQYTRKLVKEGRLTKLSFAYDVLDSAPVVLADGTKANELRELKLYEVSLVPIPANQLTEVLEVKDGEHDETHAAIVEALTDDNEEHADEKNAEVNEKAPSDEEPPAESPAGVAEALSAIRELADRLDGIADMIDDMAERIGVLVDAQKNDNGITAKAAAAEVADSDDNAEATHDGNAEVDEKAGEDTLQRMARYINGIR